MKWITSCCSVIANRKRRRERGVEWKEDRSREKMKLAESVGFATAPSQQTAMILILRQFLFYFQSLTYHSQRDLPSPVSAIVLNFRKNGITGISRVVKNFGYPRATCPCTAATINRLRASGSLTNLWSIDRNFPQTRLNEAVAADAFACPVSAVCP